MSLEPGRVAREVSFIENAHLYQKLYKNFVVLVQTYFNEGKSLVAYGTSCHAIIKGPIKTILWHRSLITESAKTADMISISSEGPCR
jgi:hypothetical protein